jgi:enamine deaminase RidA (YjgF/YER057c/UK114 family)
MFDDIFFNNPPAHIIFPCDGLGMAGTIVEIRFIALRTDDRFPHQIISASSVPELLFHEPHAKKMDPYLFLSTQILADENGPAAQPNLKPPYYSSQIKNEIKDILENTEGTCYATGDSLQDIMRSQSVFLDMDDLHPAFEAWREAFPSDPLVNTSAQVEGPMAVPGCRITKSLVAYIS